MIARARTVGFPGFTILRMGIAVAALGTPCGAAPLKAATTAQGAASRGTADGPQGPLSFVELHWLRPDATVNEAVAYVKWVSPIAKRHRGRIIEVFNVAGTLHGDLKPAFVWIYQFDNKAAMEARHIVFQEEDKES